MMNVFQVNTGTEYDQYVIDPDTRGRTHILSNQSMVAVSRVVVTSPFFSKMVMKDDYDLYHVISFTGLIAAGVCFSLAMFSCGAAEMNPYLSYDDFLAYNSFNTLMSSMAIILLTVAVILPMVEIYTQRGVNLRHVNISCDSIDSARHSQQPSATIFITDYMPQKNSDIALISALGVGVTFGVGTVATMVCSMLGHAIEPEVMCLIPVGVLIIHLINLGITKAVVNDRVIEQL